MSDESQAAADAAISADAALADVATPPQQAVVLEQGYDHTFSIVAVEGEREWTKLTALRDHFRHKGNWSWFLMGLMGFMVAFQSFLIVMVGIGWWDFTKYEWLLPTLMIQYLLQVAGLAFVAVRSLFKDVS